MTKDFTKTSELMQLAISDGIFPFASLLVAKDGDIVYNNFFGSASDKTIFDIASLTKPVVTTTLSMIAASEGLFNLDDSLEKFFPDSPHLKSVKVFHLLNHSSGLPAWKPYYNKIAKKDVASAAGRKQVVEAVLREPLEYKTGSKSLYSDIDFILLDLILSQIFSQPLISLAEELITKPLGMKNSFYRIVRQTLWSSPEFIPANDFQERDFSKLNFAPTENCPWRKKVIRGFVHDQNCYAMGGISGHAGLFSTAFDLHLFVKEFVSCYQGAGTLLNQEIIREFIDSGKVINEGTFLFGWDRPAENNSQAGNLFSKNSIGHLGYTGCSLWVDLARDFWVILLSNRVHPTATNEMIKAFRPGLHDQIVGDLGV